MTIARVVFGTREDMVHSSALKAALAEFISTFIFVFAGKGSTLAFINLTPTGQVAASLAHAFSLTVAVSVAANISGGHVNPAVTFGVFIGGKITFFRSIMYWFAQLLGSIFACSLLHFCTGGIVVAPFYFSGVDFIQVLALEAVMTFGLVFTVYSAVLDSKDNVGLISPIAIGFIVGANILVGGAFDGASMNPALSFGPAMVSWSWENQWLYWAGPLAGSTIAGLVYQIFF